MQVTSIGALVIAHVKCVDPGQTAAWSDWYDAVWLPALLEERDTATDATLWSLANQPEPGLPGLGFSHVAVFECVDLSAVARLAARAAELRTEQLVHPCHCVTAADVWVPHGRWVDRPSRSPHRTGMILAEVMVADPSAEAGWHEWYDAQHIPDMLDTGAFAAATRWERSPRRQIGPNHLTVYDIEGIEVAAAVERSAQAMPGIVAAGRKFPGHTGVLTVTLVPSG
jgi:hypothetical protein